MAEHFCNRAASVLFVQLGDFSAHAALPAFAEGFGHLLERLDKTFDIVTREAEIGISAPYLPAQGKYSSGRTAESLLRTFSVDWDGSVGSTNVGFQIDKGGLPSIFLIRGTPKMRKDQKLYDAFYGDRIRGEVLNAQREIFMKALGEAMK